MSKPKLVFSILIFSFFVITFRINATYESERQDIYDYKEFFDELYPEEETEESCSTIGTVYAECSGVSVNGKTYSLEDYVAGVLYAEFHTAIDNEEMGKAAAIAVRSYTLGHTNNCSSSIGSSSYEQNFVQESSGVVNLELYKKYAESTAGQVLTYNGNIIEAPYFAFSQGECQSTFTQNGTTMCKASLETWFGSGEYHDIVVPYDALPSGVLGAHYKGMAVWAAVYQAEKEGYNHEKLLKTYYGEKTEISKLTSSGENNNSNAQKLSYTCDDTDGGLSSASADGFKKRTAQPNSSNKFYFSNDNILYSAGYTGQCTWYAYGRANEILSNAESSLKWTVASNAGNWYDDNKAYGSKGFKSSTDVNNPKVGAIIVWTDNGTSAGCSGCGHVGVVEAVNSDNTIDITEANISGIKSSSNPYGWQYVKNMSLSEVKSRWGGYSFIAYIYIVE